MQTMNKSIKLNVFAVTALAVLPTISYGYVVGQSAVSNLQTQAQSVSNAGLAAIQNAPSQLVDAATAPSSTPQVAQPNLTGVSGGIATTATQQPATSAAPVEVLPPKPSLEVMDVDKDNPYTTYPEGTGNYNINAHHEDEVLPEQSDFNADESLHDDEIKIKPFDGFALGAQGLYAISKVKEKQSGGNDVNVNSNNGGFGGIASYGYVWNRFYAGGELFVNYLPMDKNGGNQTINGVNAEVAKIKSTYDAGADVRIGGTLSRNVLLYGSFGVDVSNFDITSESSSAFTSAKQSKTAIGFAPGIGLDVALTKSLIATAKFRYIFFPSIDDDYTRTIDHQSISNSYDISRAVFSLGLDYHFH